MTPEASPKYSTRIPAWLHNHRPRRPDVLQPIARRRRPGLPHLRPADPRLPLAHPHRAAAVLLLRRPRLPHPRPPPPRHPHPPRRHPRPRPARPLVAGHPRRQPRHPHRPPPPWRHRAAPPPPPPPPRATAP